MKIPFDVRNYNSLKSLVFSAFLFTKFLENSNQFYQLNGVGSLARKISNIECSDENVATFALDAQIHKFKRLSHFCIVKVTLTYPLVPTSLYLPIENIIGERFDVDVCFCVMFRWLTHSIGSSGEEIDRELKCYRR